MREGTAISLPVELGEAHAGGGHGPVSDGLPCVEGHVQVPVEEDDVAAAENPINEGPNVVVTTVGVGEDDLHRLEPRSERNGQSKQRSSKRKEVSTRIPPPRESCNPVSADNPSATLTVHGLGPAGSEPKDDNPSGNMPKAEGTQPQRALGDWRDGH